MANVEGIVYKGIDLLKHLHSDAHKACVDRRNDISNKERERKLMLGDTENLPSYVPTDLDKCKKVTYQEEIF